MSARHTSVPYPGANVTSDARAGGNRLRSATSPYLLQHKDNPVDWYQWGPEAFDASRSSNRPIFLSIGYSACHWCHVMEKESFEDEATAALMNRLFVNVKVDREERPDLDDIYMTAVQMLTGSGGWPMSVWLTPDLKPFYGGTYFPRHPVHGRPAFSQVLQALAEAWRKDRRSVEDQAEQVHEAVSRHMTREPGGVAPAPPDNRTIERAVEEMSDRFDHVHGGFGHAPKFPPSSALLLMLPRARQTGDENLLRMATLTLDRMAHGGMHDQIGGGFHRYSVDERWLVPHFEKMLYDNAQLAEVYLEAWSITGFDRYRTVASDIFDFVLREMTDAAGPFYSSLDADSAGEEGTYYVWKPGEITEALGPEDGALVGEFYGITPGGNFEGGTSIPHVDTPLERFAERKRIPVERLSTILREARSRLLAKRAERARPHLDDKVLSAWNGLMIAALARGGRVMVESRLTAAAAKAAEFILGSMRSPEGALRVSWRAGRSREESFLDDQAFFIRALLALHEATREPRWLSEVRSLLAATDSIFRDPAGGGYFFAPAGRKDLIVRAMNPHDGALPSGNSVMARSLVALHRITSEDDHRARAETIFTSFAAGMSAVPSAFHGMLIALHEHLERSAPAQAGQGSLVEVTAEAAPWTAGSEEPIVAKITIHVREGWHLNAARPTLDHLVPTRVILREDGPVTLESADYPEGRPLSLGTATDPIPVYEGSQTIRLRMRPAGPLAPGTRVQLGVVAYQACNEGRCLAPGEIGFEIPIRIEAPAS